MHASLFCSSIICSRQSTSRSHSIRMRPPHDSPCLRSSCTRSNNTFIRSFRSYTCSMLHSCSCSIVTRTHTLLLSFSPSLLLSTRSIRRHSDVLMQRWRPRHRCHRPEAEAEAEAEPRLRPGQSAALPRQCHPRRQKRNRAYTWG